MSKLSTKIKSLPSVQKGAIVCSLVLLAIACTQPAFATGGANPEAWSDGLLLLVIGGMSFLGGAVIPGIIWLANPLCLLSILLTIRGKKNNLVPAVIATLLAISFLLLDEIMVNEGGGTAKITKIGAGYTLWLLSIIVLTVGLAIGNKQRKAAAK